MATKAGRYDEVLFSTHGTSGTIKAMNADTVQVEVFNSDGTTNATLYDDRDKTAYSGTGSIVTPDSAGNIEFFADPGIYVLKISDDGTVLRTDTVNVSVDGAEAGAFPVLTENETVSGAWTFSTDPTLADGSSAVSLTEADARFGQKAGAETVSGAWDFTGGISENGTALSGTYAPVVTQVSIDAVGLGKSGSATEDNTAGVHGMSLPDSVNQWVATTVQIPDSEWSTFDVVVETWVKSGSGDVVLRFDHAFIGDGDTITVANGVSVTRTVGATDTQKDLTLATGVSVTANKLLSLRVIRLGGDAADTLAAGVILKTIKLVKAS